jgi:hypothetical protein
VLRLDLTASDYTANFVPIAGKTWTDSFAGSCHRAQGVVGDFLVNASGAISIPRTKSGSKNITLTSYGAFNAAVDLAAAGLPNGVTATFSLDPATPPADGSLVSKLTLRVASTAATGTYPLTINGVSGAFTRSVRFNLIVK